MPQESEYLTRAADAYQRALALYTQSTNLPNVTESIRSTQRAHDQSERRLSELTPPEPEIEPGPEPSGPVESSIPSSPEPDPRGSVASEDLEPWA